MLPFTIFNLQNIVITATVNDLVCHVYHTCFFLVLTLALGCFLMRMHNAHGKPLQISRVLLLYLFSSGSSLLFSILPWHVPGTVTFLNRDYWTLFSFSLPTLQPGNSLQGLILTNCRDHLILSLFGYCSLSEYCFIGFFFSFHFYSCLR